MAPSATQRASTSGWRLARALALLLVPVLLGCSTLSIKAVGAVELTREGLPPERLELVAYKNESLGGVALLCLATFIFYGGGCWAYLAYPTSDEEAAFENEISAVVKSAAACGKVAFIKAGRDSWSAKPETLEMTRKDGKPEGTPKTGQRGTPQKRP